MKTIPSFPTDAAKREWFIKNADYFTVIRYTNRRYERQERSTLAEAQKLAAGIIKREPKGRPLLIYAVVNNSDSYVETIRG